MLPFRSNVHISLFPLSLSSLALSENGCVVVSEILKVDGIYSCGLVLQSLKMVVSVRRIDWSIEAAVESDGKYHGVFSPPKDEINPAGSSRPQSVFHGFRTLRPLMHQITRTICQPHHILCG